MAVALDANLGTFNTGGSSTTVALTTANAVASGGFIVIGVICYSTSATVTGVAGGGLSWTVDKQARPAVGGPQADLVAIVSAQAPSGLAASTVITATYSESVDARIIGGNSFTGVATSSPVDGTPTGPTYTLSGAPAAGWATASYAIAAGSIIYAVCFAENTDTGNTPTSPSLEGWEQARLADDYMGAAGYRIEASGGSYTVAGTFGASALHNNVAVAYLAAAGGAAEKQSFYAFRRRSVTR